MDKIKVKNVIISKQPENSKNFLNLMKIIKKREINLIVISKYEKIYIEKNIYFEFLWPLNAMYINENKLNNNSLVCKFHYNNFSILFTGDIEKIAEDKLLSLYSKNFLNSTILKVAHHGSSTSSSQEFIDAVDPKIALIGVGKENKFNHPSPKTIEILESKECKIYRTDLCGETIIKVDKFGKINVKKYIN